VLIARRAASAGSHRLAAAAQRDAEEATVVVWGDDATTTMGDATSDRLALEATPTPPATTQGRPAPHATSRTGRLAARSRRTKRPRLPQARRLTGRPPVGAGAVPGRHDRGRSHRPRAGACPTATRNARCGGRVKADLARQQEGPATRPGRACSPQRTDQVTSDQQRDRTKVATRLHDGLTVPAQERGDQASSRTEPSRDKCWSHDHGQRSIGTCRPGRTLAGSRPAGGGPVSTGRVSRMG
jgi:hypothetical protein